jgi:hypothetical protein
MDLRGVQFSIRPVRELNIWAISPQWKSRIQWIGFDPPEPSGSAQALGILEQCTLQPVVLN